MDLFKQCCLNYKASSDDSEDEKDHNNTSGNNKEKDLKLIRYNSKGDKCFEKLEKNYNLFGKIKFQEYLNSLVNFSITNATLVDNYKEMDLNYSMNEPFFNEDFDKDLFQSFIENKIFKHKNLYELAGEKESMASIFKQGFLFMHDQLGEKLFASELMKGKNNINKSNIVKKGDVICFGFLYCGGNNLQKVKALFNIFKENHEIKTNEKFSRFLLCLFLISSFCMLSTRVKFNKYSEIGSITKDEVKELFCCTKLEHCIHLVDITNKLIFGNDLSRSLSLQEFKSLFEESNQNKTIGYLLSPSGIRFMLQENNTN